MKVSINKHAATANRCVSYLYWSLFVVRENKQGVTSLFILIVFFSPTAVFAVITQDPMQNYLKDSPPYKEDKLIVYKADFNEDGRDEVFISTDSKYLNNAKAGRSWSLYISVPSGYIRSYEKSKVSLTFHSPKSLVRLSNGRLGIIHYFASSARAGSVLAYYLDTDNVLQFQKMGEIQAEPGEFDKKYNQALSDKGSTVSAAKTTFKVRKLEEIYTLAQIAGLKSYKDDFYSNHYIRKDPDDRQAYLVYRKSDNVLVGRKKFGVFIPLEKTEMKSEQIQRAQNAVKPVPGMPGYVPPVNKAGNENSTGEKANGVSVIALILGLVLMLGVGLAVMLKRKRPES